MLRTSTRAAAGSTRCSSHRRTGWDLHIEFGLTHPAHYLLMYGQQRPGDRSAAAQQADDRLRMLVERAAAAGRLVVSVETAASMIHAAGTGGLALHLISTGPEHRDSDLSSRLREAVLSATTGDALPEAPGYAQHVTVLKATLDETGTVLTVGELTLLGELLDRLVKPIAEHGSTASSHAGASGG